MNEKVVTTPMGTRCWYSSGQLHRVQGPAVVYLDGSEEWWFEGRRHRMGGPAITFKCGLTKWYMHGLKHCLSGPAVTNRCGRSHSFNKCLEPTLGLPACHTEYWVNGWYTTGDDYYRFVDTLHEELLVPPGSLFLRPNY